MDTWHSIPAPPTAGDSSSDLISISSTSTEPEKSYVGQGRRSRGRPRRINESANNLITLTHPENRNKNNGLPPPPDSNNHGYSCPICFKKFTALSSVQRHELTHTENAKPFSCDMCEQKFTQSSSLNTHKRVIHQGEKLFTCQICTKSFRKNYDLQKHLEAHAKNTARTHPNRMDAWTITAEGKRLISCQICKKSFRKNYGLKRHLESHANKTIDVKGKRQGGQQEQYSCSACPEIFYSYQYQIFVDHLQTIHGITYTEPEEQIESSGKYYRCAYCPMKYRRNRGLQEFTDHLKCHKTRIEREQQEQGGAPVGIDDLIPTLVSAAAAAQPVSDLPIGRGKLLPLASATKVELLKHYDPTIELPTCSACGKSFTELKALEVHRKIHGERVRKYACTVCSKKFTTAGDLRQHESTLICGKKLKEQQQGQDAEELEGGEKRDKEFRIHPRRRRGRAHRTLCTFCQKFIRKKSIKAHIRTVHLGEKQMKQYVSKYCQQRFARLIPCQRHEKTHEEQGICKIFTRSRQCTICGIEGPNFPSAYLANEHFMKNHNRELKIPVEKIVLKPINPGEDEDLSAWELCATCGNCYTVADYRLHEALCGDTPFHTRLAEGFGWRDEGEPEGVEGDEASDQPVKKKIKISDKIFDNNWDDRDQVDQPTVTVPSSLTREEQAATSSSSAAFNRSGKRGRPRKIVQAVADLQSSEAEEDVVNVKIETEDVEDGIGGFDWMMADTEDNDFNDFPAGLIGHDLNLNPLLENANPELPAVNVTPALSGNDDEIFKTLTEVGVKTEVPEQVQTMLKGVEEERLEEVDREQECPLCGLTFKNMLEFLAHDSLEHKRGAISLIRMSFKSLQDEPEYQSQCFHGISVLQASKDTLHIPWYTCEKCGRSSKLKSQILGHKRVALAATDTCPPTQLEGIFKPKLISNDPRIKMLDNGNAQCTICDKIYTNVYIVKKHLPVHEGKFVCPYCGRNLSTDATYQDHLSTHTGEKRYKCDKCDEAYHSAPMLFSHKRSAHEKRIYECELCPYSGKYELFYQHVKKHHHNSSAIKFRKTTKFRQLVVEREAVVPSILACDRCPSIFKSRLNLTRHLASVHGQDEREVAASGIHKPSGYPCEHCGKLIVDKPGLQRHILVFHRTDGLKVKFFSCKLCQKEYSLISSMRHHLRSAHAQEIPTELLEQDMAHGEDPEGKSTVLDIENYFVRLKPQKSGSVNNVAAGGGVEHQSNESNNST